MCEYPVPPQGAIRSGRERKGGKRGEWEALRKALPID